MKYINQAYTYNADVFDMLCAKVHKAKLSSSDLYLHTVTIDPTIFRPYYKNHHHSIKARLEVYLSEFNQPYIASIEFSSNCNGYHAHILTSSQSIPKYSGLKFHTSLRNNYHWSRAVKYIAKDTSYEKEYYYNCTSSALYNKQFDGETFEIKPNSLQESASLIFNDAPSHKKANTSEKIDLYLHYFAFRFILKFTSFFLRRSSKYFYQIRYP
jgi:hypothetical protein